jgi:hypothetical protein
MGDVRLGDLRSGRPTDNERDHDDGRDQAPTDAHVKYKVVLS